MPNIPKKNNPFYQAQAILARRDQSEHEMRTKLKRKGFTAEEIEEVVAWLYEQKLLDDTRYARLYIESLLLGKPIGPRYVQAKLMQRGVPQEIVNAVVETIFTAEYEMELVRDAIERWRKVHIKDVDNSQKLWRYLAGRGFSSSAITRVIS